MKVVFAHPLDVGRDGGAFYCNAKTLCCVGRVNGNLVGGLVTVRETKVVVLCLKVNEWKDELILDHFPKDSCHLVAVHFDERCFHFNLFHSNYYMRFL